MIQTYVYVTKPCQVIMLRCVEDCDERIGKEAAVVQFEFPSRRVGRQCVTFTC